MNFTEKQLIEKISQLVSKKDPSIICGIGDDCAVLADDQNHYQLLTTDCLVERVHFDFAYFSPRDVGIKAMAVNVSDIAAMGGTPEHAVVTLGIPKNFTQGQVLECYDGLQDEAMRSQVHIVGGNLSRSLSEFWVSVTLTGRVKQDCCKMRSGARLGDYLFVTGPLGSSALGLFQLCNQKDGDTAKQSLLGITFTKSHKNPKPHLPEGKFLGSRPYVTSMIDVSDGLVQDLGHICSQSGLGAEILLKNIPCEKNLHFKALEYGLNPHELILGGGEDYVLLFSICHQKEEELVDDCNKAKIEVFKIGSLVEKKLGIRVLNELGQEIKVKKGGFDHFGKYDALF